MNEQPKTTLYSLKDKLREGLATDEGSASEEVMKEGYRKMFGRNETTKATCETNGHLYGLRNKCVFCGVDRPAVELDAIKKNKGGRDAKN
jgi:hypothetical protein